MQSYAAVISVMERVSDRCWIHGHQRLRVNVCEGFSRKHTCQSTDNNEEDEDVVDDDDGGDGGDNTSAVLAAHPVLPRSHTEPKSLQFIYKCSLTAIS